MVIVIAFSPMSNFLLGIPANPKRDHHWVKTKSTKSVFCQHIFNSMPRFFAHHQSDLAQRDGKKMYMLLSMITAVSRLLYLDFDFTENYTHINQVLIPQFATSCMHSFFHSCACFFCAVQLMSHMKWFKKLSTVMV